MAKTWLSIKVELLGGGGTELWPRPGRTFALGPSHTFEDLAEAINAAFARWDHSHLSVFTLSDGRILADEFNGPELGNTAFGPVQEVLDYARVKVARTVKAGDEFKFTFDLGDDWTHHCTVNPGKVDPLEVLGIKPAKPLAYWGWGAMPDQYGRRWADDDGEAPTPPEPSEPHPMTRGAWPNTVETPLVDDAEVRAATATKDADRFLSAISGSHIDEALQQLGAGMSMALEQRRDRAETIALSVLNRLTFRAFPGDGELADALLAKLRSEPSPGLELDVDIEMLSIIHEGMIDESTGGYIDLETGDVIDAAAIDYGDNGDDIDIESEPDRWLGFGRSETRAAWEDMSAFIGRLRDPALRERGQNTIEGQGAFRRFRSFVDDNELLDRWHMFSEDRKFGRARALLAENDISVI
ncbi:UPF0158 family protein [Brevibacterium sp.]|uniref:UPF0158 family protein n=1 Tax=Brevibacterium sp. TaxID=1701 RepID=UPI002648EA8E|nr:UPF0158 family protein [Brevibacterium sp.]MDN5833517.1 hypothetical protein [Brevibacterium sp.]MDN6604897.1 hypothetical protein [Brevibacterium sp.]